MGVGRVIRLGVIRGGLLSGDNCLGKICQDGTSPSTIICKCTLIKGKGKEKSVGTLRGGNCAAQLPPLTVPTDFSLQEK